MLSIIVSCRPVVHSSHSDVCHLDQTTVSYAATYSYADGLGDTFGAYGSETAGCVPAECFIDLSGGIGGLASMTSGAGYFQGYLDVHVHIDTYVTIYGGSGQGTAMGTGMPFQYGPCDLYGGGFIYSSCYYTASGLSSFTFGVPVPFSMDADLEFSGAGPGSDSFTVAISDEGVIVLDASRTAIDYTLAFQDTTQTPEPGTLSLIAIAAFVGSIYALGTCNARNRKTPIS